MLYSQTFTKKNPYFFQNGGARARRAGPGSAFESVDEVTGYLLLVLYRVWMKWRAAYLVLYYVLKYQNVCLQPK